jgi:hypothetical protein
MAVTGAEFHTLLGSVLFLPLRFVIENVSTTRKVLQMDGFAALL